MKKVFYSVSLIALVAMFAACGSSPREDGMKLKQKKCECAKLEGSGNYAQLEKCDQEYRAMKKEFEAKYKDNEQAQKEFKEGRKSVKCDY